MFEQYTQVLFVVTSLLAMMVLQALIATGAHRKQTEYVPGIVSAELDHFSFVFRSNRTFLNSLENVPLFVLSVLVACLVGVNAEHLLTVTVIFFVARLVHMVLFYAIATNKNPSPRSYFYMIGLFAQLYLIGVIYASF
ncbi:MAPEG family protein [Psychrosphaera sp. B3R10]|uniref:MAPEG family protein n=1 Tax=unclassified Psychrosphaera TaxID=2641570 RepID=UPI001C0A4E99|nr:MULTISPECIES: MAPEG family protein [unclassified Psychrosphaera]MBU2883156.1 MAPEG family protein [Psychrosphaera sp. I2R16]MBU2988612.1 MAPEG family protein [Psychrosphaera sp. B3R10]MDO6719675.1 MAPEG family protein [Psychrosphaera sp. 1_MG-2023]